MAHESKLKREDTDLTDFLIVRRRTAQSHRIDAQAAGAEHDVHVLDGMILLIDEIMDFRQLDAAKRKAAIQKVIDAAFKDRPGRRR